MSQTTEWQPLSEPRAAATVVLMRDAAHGFEVLLTRRPDHLRFMGGATVFPGGAVAAADLDPRWEAASNLSRADAATALDEPDQALALGYFVAALREAHEEVGFVMANGPVDELSRHDSDEPARFLERSLDKGLKLDAAALAPAGRWVTPLGSPIRFDTRFFLARAPEGWDPAPDPAEVADARWVSPAAALVELSRGLAMMAPPTVEMLQRLDGFTDVDEAITALGRKGEGIGTARVLSVRLSALVHVVLAPNPGLMTGPGTNTYVVGAGPTIIIDPAMDDDEYLDTVLAAAGDVALVAITHRHPDHVGGAHALTARIDVPVRAFGDADAGGVPVVPLADGDRLEVGGARLVALHTPGHASDHICFYLDGAASLFAGDSILGEGTAVIAPPDGDMRAYMETLERLRALDIDRVYPGHFRPLDGGTQVIDGYIAHRRARESAILAAVSSGASTPEEIVAIVYTDTPAAMHPVAAYQVLGHLEMLGSEGRVSREGDRWKATPLP